MIDLSIIIVSYNVESFISLCLDSIFSSDVECAMEVIIIDNHSQDRSVVLIAERYPDVRIVQNNENRGFAAACNQGAKVARGRLLYFCNPDTMMAEKALQSMYQSYERMLQQGEKIAVGAKMLDGTLQYLPESSRYLPFWRSALSKLFSSAGSGYYRDLSDEALSATEVLTGASLMVDRDEYNAAGGFSEEYFMYGEDIELSKRLVERGVSLYVDSDAELIHFKGESGLQGKGYHRHFYRSLGLYAYRNFFNRSQNVFVKGAFTGVAELFGWTKYVLLSAWRPVLDYMMSLLSFVLVGYLWGHFFHGDSAYFDWRDRVLPLISGFSVLLVLIYFCQGIYVRQKKKVEIGTYLVAPFIILIVYSLLPEEYRFSRVVVLFGLIIPLLGRWLWSIMGSRDDELILYADFDAEDMVSLAKATLTDDISVATGILYHNRTSLSAFIAKYRDQGLPVYVYDVRGDYIFNSATGRTIGSRLDGVSHYRLSDPRFRHQKQLLESFICLLIVLLFPLWGLFQKNKAGIRNIHKVWSKEYSLMGYDSDREKGIKLPYLPPAILPISDLKGTETGDIVDYAMHYSVWRDIKIGSRNFGTLIHQLTKKS